MFLGVVLSDEMIHSQLSVKVHRRSLNDFGFASISNFKEVEATSCLFIYFLKLNYRSFRNNNPFWLKGLLLIVDASSF